MEAARAALDGAVAALFTVNAHQPEEQHVVCPGCGCSPETPEEWRALRQYPVLSRWVIASWTRHAETLASVSTAKRRRDGGPSAMDLRVHSMSALCSQLFQNGVRLTGSAEPGEIVKLLVDTMARPFVEVLTRVLKNRLVSIDVRMHILQVALPAHRGVEVMPHSAIESVCCTLVEDLLKLSTNTATQAATLRRGSRKRNRESMKGSVVASIALCTDCNTGDGRRQVYSTHRSRLIQELEKWKTVHSSKRERNRAVVDALQAVESLLETLKAPDIVQSFVSGVLVPTSSHSFDNASAQDPSIPWDQCDRVLESVINELQDSNSTTQPQAAAWLLVWRRLRHRDRDASSTTIAELVRMCLSADQLALSRPLRDKGIGFQVAMAIANEALGDDAAVLHILRALRRSANQSQGIAGPLSAISAWDCRLLVQYASHCLTEDSARAQVPPCTQVSSACPSSSHLTECVVSIFHIVERCGNAGDHRELFTLWQSLLKKPPHHQPAAPAWTQLLTGIRECCGFMKAFPVQCIDLFQEFVVDLLVKIVISDGSHVVIDSVLSIPSDEASQSTLQELFDSITVHPSILSKLLARICVAASRRQWPLDGGGVRRFLLPSLKREHNREGLQTLVDSVSEQLRWTSNRSAASHAFVYLLFLFDSFHARNRSENEPVFDTEADKPGMLAASNCPVWHELLRYYGHASDRFSTEPREFLSYATTLLRGVDAAECPLDLDGNLSIVLSQASATSAAQAETPERVISHSDPSLQAFLEAFDGVDGHACTAIIQEHLASGKIDDLLLSLRRWLRFLQSSVSAVDEGIRQQLVLLVNRLVFVGGEPFASLRSTLVPVDTVLVHALQSYATQSNSSVSIVRLNLLLRSYLSVSRVPDLVQLSSAVVDAMLDSVNASVRDGMLKLQAGFAHWILHDVLIAKLREALAPLLSDAACPRGLKNALAVITASYASPDTRVLALSSELFTVAMAEKWLAACVLHVTTGTSSDGTTSAAVEEFLSAMEAMVLHNPSVRLGEIAGDWTQPRSKAFNHAHTLVAMLSTVQVAFSSGEWESPLIERVNSLTKRLNALLQEATRLGKSTAALLCITRQPQASQTKAKPAQKKTIVVTSGITLVGKAKLPELKDIPAWFSASTSGAASATQYYLPFGSWLASVFDWSSTADAGDCVATAMIVSFYLPVQFHGDVTVLTTEWIKVWITASLTRQQCIALRASQRRLLQQLLSRLPRKTTVWQRLELPLYDLLGSRGSLPAAFTATLITHVVSSLDLVLLCSLHPSVAQGSSECVVEMADSMGILLSIQATDSVHVFASMLEMFVHVCLSVAQSGEVALTVVQRAVQHVATSVDTAINRECDSAAALAQWRGHVRRWRQQYGYMVPTSTAAMIFPPLLLE